MFSSYNTKIEICQKNYRINYNKDMHFELNKEHVSSMTYGIEQRTRFFSFIFFYFFELMIPIIKHRIPRRTSMNKAIKAVKPSDPTNRRQILDFSISMQLHCDSVHAPPVRCYWTEADTCVLCCWCLLLSIPYKHSRPKRPAVTI